MLQVRVTDSRVAKDIRLTFIAGYLISPPNAIFLNLDIEKVTSRAKFRDSDWSAEVCIPHE